MVGTGTRYIPMRRLVGLRGLVDSLLKCQACKVRYLRYLGTYLLIRRLVARLQQNKKGGDKATSV